MHRILPGANAAVWGGFGQGLLAGFCLLLVLSASRSATAQQDACGAFSAPRRVTDGTGMATQTATGLDITNNAYISSVIHEKILVRIVGPSVDADVPVAPAGLGQGDPDFATTYTGLTYMSFSQLNDATPGEGREIYLTDNNGGGGKFHDPVNVSVNRVDEYAPRLVLDSKGVPHLAWAQKVGEETRVIYWNQSFGKEPPKVAAMGDYPHLFVDEAGTVHLVYSRDNDLLYNNNSSGDFTNEAHITTTPSDPESGASIGVDPAGNVLIAYESRSSLYYATKAPTGHFGAPRLVDAGGIIDPRIHVRSRGQVTIVYEKAGDIFYVVGQSSFLTSPTRLCEHTDAVESHPSLEIDLAGNTHVSFIRDGDVYYTNNASQPVAEFGAEPTTGEVPLTVRFGDLSSGGVQIWEWDFGDGSTSVESNPTHLYTQPGRYDVTLKVFGPGGTEGTQKKEKLIYVQDPYYTMSIPDQRVFPGQKEVWFPIITSRRQRTQGFQIMVTYDPNYLIFAYPDDYKFENTILSGRAKEPELYVRNDKGTFLEIGCIYEFSEPFDPDLIFLPPGENQVLQQLVFDVSESAPQGAKTKVALVNDYSISKIANIFIEEGFTKIPALRSSTVEVLIVQPPFPRLFLRGDTDGNGKLELTDAVRVLNYLFLGGVAPGCLDAADVNDKGKIDISSAITLLGYLFLGGAQPAVPYPNKGLDATPDDLPDCL